MKDSLMDELTKQWKSYFKFSLIAPPVLIGVLLILSFLISLVGVRYILELFYIVATIYIIIYSIYYFVKSDEMYKALKMNRLKSNTLNVLGFYLIGMLGIIINLITISKVMKNTSNQ